MFEQDVKDWVYNYLNEEVGYRSGMPRCPYAKEVLDDENAYQFHTFNNEGELNRDIGYILGRHHDKRVIICQVIDMNVDTLETISQIYNQYYSGQDKLFIAEQHEINGNTYNLLLIHSRKEMEDAIQYLKENTNFYREKASVK